MSKIKLRKSSREHFIWVNRGPIIENVEVTNPSVDNSEPEYLPALVDTGADVTAIPKWVLRTLKIAKEKTGMMATGVTSKTQKPMRYHCVQLKLCGLTIQTKSAVAWPHNYILLGRDVLKKSTLRVCWVKDKKGTLRIKRINVEK